MLRYFVTVNCCQLDLDLCFATVYSSVYSMDHEWNDVLYIIVQYRYYTIYDISYLWYLFYHIFSSKYLLLFNMSSFPFVWIIISCCLNIASLLVYSAKLLPSIEAISPNLPYVATFDQTNCQLRSVEEPWIATRTVSSLEDRSRHLGWMWRELGTCLRDLSVSTNCVRHLDPLGCRLRMKGMAYDFFRSIS